MSPKRKPKKTKTTLDYCEMNDLDLNEFMSDLIRDRSLFAVLSSLETACAKRAEHFRNDLEKGQHPSVEALCEQEIEFFDDVHSALTMAHGLVEHDWKDREMPSCADGQIRIVSKRASSAGQRYLESLLVTLNDPATSEAEWNKAAGLLAHDGQGMIWYDGETGKPNFELAKSFGEGCGELIDPEVPWEQKRKAAAALQEFIVGNGQRRTTLG